MKLYIVKPDIEGGQGDYHLIAEDGTHLASHHCSNSSYARGDLIDDRPERKEKFKQLYGDYKVLWLGEDEMTLYQLSEKNKAKGGLDKAKLPQITLVVEDDDGTEHEITKFI